MPRQHCSRCARPESHCLCHLVLAQQCKTPVLILQHPDEANHPFTTSRFAQLGASSVLLLSGLEFSLEDIRRHLGGFNEALDSERLVLVYPDHNYAPHPSKLLADKKASLSLTASTKGFLFLDGTWRNTRELLLNNPWLAQLTTLTIDIETQTEYQIRKANKQGALATIEAVGHLLSALESDFDLDAYLAPFRELVSVQMRYDPLTRGS